MTKLTDLIEKELAFIKGTPMKEYHQVHYWLKKNFGKADKCESKLCKNISTRFEWAKLKSKKYECKRGNFWKLCSRCHHRYDWEEKTRKVMSEARKGIPLSKEHAKKLSIAISKIIKTKEHKLNLSKSHKKGRDTNRHWKLNTEKVKDIRVLLAKGIVQSIIAKKFRVTQVTVSMINTRKIWVD